MLLDSGNLIELAIAGMGGLAAIGLTVLRFAMNGLERQHTLTRQLIEEKFSWAESQRQEAREMWEHHFSELKQDDAAMEQRLHQIETRVTTIEVKINTLR